MRKVEQKMIECIKSKKTITLGNTSVVYYPAIDTPLRSRLETSKVFLHGNHLATWIHDKRHHNRVDMNKDTWSAWPTSTTRSRLRALGFDVSIKGGKAYLDGKPCSGN